jgi:hypothetical protein
MRHFYSGLLQLSIGIKAAAVIEQRLRIDLSFRKAIHFPWLAEKTTGPAVLRTFTLVMCHGLRSRACCFLGGGDRSLYFLLQCAPKKADHAARSKASPSIRE